MSDILISSESFFVCCILLSHVYMFYAHASFWAAQAYSKFLAEPLCSSN